MVILVILGTMLFPATRGVVSRLEQSRCTANLRNLHLGMTSYLTDHDRVWPQIDITLSQTEPEKFAGAWVDTLDDYGVTPEVWICPTIQKLFGNPDFRGEDARIDYMGNQYRPQRNAPYEFPTDPWFLETGNVHGHGNLIIYADGSVHALDDIVKIPR